MRSEGHKYHILSTQGLMAQILGWMTNILCPCRGLGLALAAVSFTPLANLLYCLLWHLPTVQEIFGSGNGFSSILRCHRLLFLPMIQSCHQLQAHKTLWESRQCSSVTPGRSRSQHCSSIACLRLVSYKRCHAKNIFLDFLRLPLNASAIVNWENSLLILKCLF